MNKQTQNRLQEILDSIDYDFNNLYNIADSKAKRRINTYIEEWKGKGLIKGQFGQLAKNIYNRTRVKNSEILELLIYSAYVEEQSKLDDIELNTFKKDANYYYQEGQKEVNKTLKKKRHITAIPEVLFFSLLMMPNAKGYIWEEYKEAMQKYNADQIYRQASICLQQNKPLKIDSDAFQILIKKQQNQKLCINGDKISGDVDLTLIGINNMAKAKGIASIDENAQVRFLAVTDDKSTDVCQSLKDQLFYINKENIFYRMYGETLKELRNVRIRANGLVLGINLPPIQHYWHWCRSSITYGDKDSYYYSNKHLKRNTFPYRDIIDKVINAADNKKGTMTIEDTITQNGITYSVSKGEAIQDHSEREIEVAKILSEKYGFNVKVMPRIKKQNEKTPDYIIDGERWDLKDFERNIDNRIKDVRKQACNFILDLRKTKVS